ncbi:hypothetical protein PAUR_b0701 [Pseudoalteromonas aurantia 208]|uniref:Uncharacterized protein n=1 Tax=Pseudoalteromonas aurantia 208 TaxID=1314867 RepID=A0ABR9EI16_9GAMM|nr:hypothetical protein [Pseudoalteromonas aurantia 208]
MRCDQRTRFNNILFKLERTRMKKSEEGNTIKRVLAYN